MSSFSYKTICSHKLRSLMLSLVVKSMASSTVQLIDKVRESSVMSTTSRPPMYRIKCNQSQLQKWVWTLKLNGHYQTLDPCQFKALLLSSKLMMSLSRKRLSAMALIQSFVRIYSVSSRLKRWHHNPSVFLKVLWSRCASVRSTVLVREYPLTWTLKESMQLSGLTSLNYLQWEVKVQVRTSWKSSIQLWRANTMAEAQLHRYTCNGMKALMVSNGKLWLEKFP